MARARACTLTVAHRAAHALHCEGWWASLHVRMAGAWARVCVLAHGEPALCQTMHSQPHAHTHKHAHSAHDADQPGQRRRARPAFGRTVVRACAHECDCDVRCVLHGRRPRPPTLVDTPRRPVKHRRHRLALKPTLSGAGEFSMARRASGCAWASPVCGFCTGLPGARARARGCHEDTRTRRCACLWSAPPAPPPDHHRMHAAGHARSVRAWKAARLLRPASRARLL